MEKPNQYRKITPSVWIHTSYRDLGSGVPIPSNGLLVRSGKELLLVDTAWTADQTREVLEWAEDEIGMAVSRAIVTHAHADKMGGLEALHQEDIPTIASHLTNRAAPGRQLVPATTSLAFETVESIAPDVEAFYPGPGHTEDNIVVYVIDEKVLFGGCLIRPAEATSLGNTDDADLTHWSTAVELVEHRYLDAEIVIPSHGDYGDRRLLDHTIDLARQAGETLPDKP